MTENEMIGTKIEFLFSDLELRYKSGELHLIQHMPYADDESEEFPELVIEFPLGPSPNDPNDSLELYERYLESIGKMIADSFNYCVALFPYGINKQNTGNDNE